MRVKLKDLKESKSKRAMQSVPKFCEVFIAEKYPPWQEKIVEIIKSCFDAKSNTFASNQEISSQIEKAFGEVNKRAMPFVQRLRDNVTQRGSISALDYKLNFSEKAILSLANEYICFALDFDKLWVKDITDAPVKVFSWLGLV